MTTIFASASKEGQSAATMMDGAGKKVLQSFAASLGQRIHQDSNSPMTPTTQAGVTAVNANKNEIRCSEGVRCVSYGIDQLKVAEDVVPQEASTSKVIQGATSGITTLLPALDQRADEVIPPVSAEVSNSTRGANVDAKVGSDSDGSTILPLVGVTRDDPEVLQSSSSEKLPSIGIPDSTRSVTADTHVIVRSLTRRAQSSANKGAKEHISKAKHSESTTSCGSVAAATTNYTAPAICQVVFTSISAIDTQSCVAHVAKGSTQLNEVLATSSQATQRPEAGRISGDEKTRNHSTSIVVAAVASSSHSKSEVASSSGLDKPPKSCEQLERGTQPVGASDNSPQTQHTFAMQSRDTAIANQIGLGPVDIVGVPRPSAVAPKAHGNSADAPVIAANQGSGELRDTVSDASADAGAPHRTLVASPTALEIAVPNGSQGWVKIRAEMAGGGGINASVTTPSASGQDSLHQDLPSLTAFLQQERIAINTVVVHAATARTGWNGTQWSLGRPMDGQRQQGASHRDDRRQRTGIAATDVLRASAISDGDRVTSYAPSGNWLSVRA